MLDRHSEIIAHFIGQFDQAAEQSLYRLHYDAFRAQLRPEDELGELLEVNVQVSSDLAADKHVAERVKYAESYVPHRAGPTEVAVSDGHWTWQEDLFAPWPNTGTAGALNIHHHLHHFADYAYYTATPVLELSAPGGVITFVYQQNTMRDCDVLLARPLDLDPGLAASRADAMLDAELMALARAADALLPGDPVLAREMADIATRIDTLRETFAGIDPEDAPEGAQVTLVSQSDGTLPGSGILVDGAPADALPDTLEDALAEHGFGAAGDEETAADAGEGGSGEGVVSGTFEIGAGETGSEADALHIIEAGGNLLMNNVVSNLAPVDAPLIVVAGAALSFTLISQVNVMSDRDTLIGAEITPCSGKDHQFKDAASAGHNIASVTWEGAVGGSLADGDGAPVGFAITEIDGDLVITTHVFQLNLVCDNDVITFETTFYEVEIGTGGNLSMDVLAQLGFQTGFDMILVGGDMLSLVSVAQLNLLFDDDLVADGDGVGADIHTSGNLLWNEAEITWHGIDTAADEMSEASGAALATMAGGQLDFEALKGEALLDGKAMPLLLTVSGNLVLDYRLEQINILADADTVQLFAEVAESHGFTPVEVSTGDNTLANVARLDIHGTDSTIMAESGVISDVVIYQAGMYDTDEDPLDPDQAGSDLASEAVAFLAEGMIDDGAGTESVGGEVIIDTGGESGTFDTLGGVVV